MSEARPPSTHVSVAEAARMLGISSMVTYKLVYSGTLPSIRRGRRVWVERAAVEARRADQERLRSQCISIDEVATFFGVHEETVRNWHLRGLLRAESIQRRLCFDERDVVVFVPPVGRPASHTPTRTLRGRYYPVPPTNPDSEGTP